MPENQQAQIVIIGGGVTGCSIAYHLAKSGVKDILLLEKGHDLTSGSTCHAAGLVTQFNTRLSIQQMRVYSVKLYQEFFDEVADASGWHKTGSLRIASSHDHFMSLKQSLSIARGIGLDLEILSPAETKKLWPELNMEGVEGSIYLPDDGWLDPHTATMYMASKAAQMGVQFSTQTLVEDIELTPKREIKALRTNKGRIACETVINAAGMWAPRIAEMVGIVMPMVPVQHQHLTTIPRDDHIFPSNTPVLRDPMNLIYVREEIGGLLIGGFETQPISWNENGVPWSHSQQVLESDWDIFESVMEGALKRIPLLEKAEVGKLVNHPDAMTPDGYPCVGPSPEVRGFWGAAGLSLNGFGMAGGLGQQITQWYLEGATDIDMTAFDIRRFGNHYRNIDYVTQRGRETYKYYYYLHFPLDEYEWGRPLRKSPLYDRVKDYGAVFGEKNGMERVNYYQPGEAWRMAGPDQRQRFQWRRPDYFEVVGEEHRACRQRVAILDMSSFGKIDIIGPDALALLQHVAANDVDGPIGSLTYTQFLNENGGIESDLTIARTGEESFRIVTGTSSLSVDMGWLHLNKPEGASVEINDVTADYAAISLWGPRSRQTLQKVSSSDFSNAAFPYISSGAIEMDGIRLLANRVSFSGELGWELYPAATDAVKVWDELMEAGKTFDIRPAGYKSIDSLRLEKGYLVWGRDITPKENPLEAGLGFAVRMNKENFIGKDALLRYKQSGSTPKKKFATMVMDGDACILYGGEAIIHQDKVIGRLRSGGYGYTVEKNIGLAYLPSDLAIPGAKLEIDSFGERIPAKVTQNALYDPQSEKARA